MGDAGFGLSSCRSTLVRAGANRKAAGGVAIGRCDNPRAVLNSAVMAIKSVKVSDTAFAAPSVCRLFLISRANRSGREAGESIGRAMAIISISSLFRAVRGTTGAVAGSRDGGFNYCARDD